MQAEQQIKAVAALTMGDKIVIPAALDAQIVLPELPKAQKKVLACILECCGCNVAK